MSIKSLIINANLLENRIALLDDGRVAELMIERIGQQSMVGNIYKGIVTRVLPGMNSAFIDIGTHRSAFLFGGDVLDPSGEYEEPELATPHRPIEELLHDGQQILVQVSKEPLGSKGPRVTTFITLAGRHIVYMPSVSHIGISRKIEDETDRLRLQEIANKLGAEHGLIFRTAALEASYDEIETEYRYLAGIWHSISSKIHITKAPSLIYKELDIIRKTVRDLYTQELEKIVVDDIAAYKEIREFLLATIPQDVNKLELFESSIPIFDMYGIEIDIGRALGTRIDLPSGGYLIIDQTEALTSFDVNTGRFVGKYNAEQTILHTNLEAAKKVVEQMIIRNLGGIIVIDFIDMENEENRELVYSQLIEELKKDRSRTNVLRINELGLVHMTRKRTSESLEHALLTSCPHCEGRGKVRSVVTESLDLIREIERCYLQTKKRHFNVTARADILLWIKTNASLMIDRLQQKGLEISLQESLVSNELLRTPSYEVIAQE